MAVSVEREFDILNRLGLHARAAAQLVRMANGFSSEIHVVKDEMEVNGKSIMGVLMLAAPKDTKILIRATGVDAEEALAAIGDLIARKFEEE